MKALSIRQPWVWCILNAGKRVENRTWATSYRGPVLIHAAKTCTVREHVDFCNSVWGTAPYAESVILAAKSHKGVPEFEDLSRGGFVARAKLVGCVHERDKHLLCAKDKPWFFGPYGFILDGVEPISFVPYKGKLGLFEVPDDLIERVKW